MPFRKRPIQEGWKRQSSDRQSWKRQQANVFRSLGLFTGSGEPIEPPGPGDLPPTDTPATIDCEPIVLSSGERGRFAFRYHSGYPYANAFGIEWYMLESDALADENEIDLPTPGQLLFYPRIMRATLMSAPPVFKKRLSFGVRRGFFKPKPTPLF